MFWKRVGCVQPNAARSGCTGQCPVVHRTVSNVPGPVSVNSPLSGLDGGVRLKFTGLFGGAPDCPVKPTVDCANGWLRNPCATRGRANGRKGAPDCPVCTGQCPVCQLPQNCNNRMRLKKEGDHAPDSYRDCPVAPRTVRCATRQKARIAFQECLQRLLASLGL
jgi:hypothetical protein